MSSQIFMPVHDAHGSIDDVQLHRFYCTFYLIYWKDFSRVSWSLNATYVILSFSINLCHLGCSCVTENKSLVSLTQAYGKTSLIVFILECWIDSLLQLFWACWWGFAFENVSNCRGAHKKDSHLRGSMF